MHRQSAGFFKGSHHAGPICCAVRATARQGGHHTLWGAPAYQIIIAISHVYDRVGIHGQGPNVVKSGPPAHAIGGPTGQGSRKVRHGTRGCHAAEEIGAITEIHGGGGSVHCQGKAPANGSPHARAIRHHPRVTTARGAGDDTRGGNSPNVVGVAKKKCGEGAIPANAQRVQEAGGSPSAICVGGEGGPCGTPPRKGAHQATGGYLSNPIAHVRGHVHIPPAIHSQGHGVHEGSSCTLAIGAGERATACQGGGSVVTRGITSGGGSHVVPSGVGGDSGA